jgi:hypothetical protein
MEFYRLRAQIDEFIPNYSELLSTETHSITGYHLKILNVISASMLKNRTEDIDEQQINRFKSSAIQKKLSQPSYGYTNFYIALRIYGRKIQHHERNLSQLKSQGRTLLKQLKPLEKTLSETGHSLLHQLEATKAELIHLLDQSTEFESLALFLNAPFLSGWKMPKDMFLSLFNINKDLKSWDGVRIQPYRELVEELPDEIDFNTLERYIFLERVESDSSCFLFDIFMEYFLMVMKKSQISAFDVLQEVTQRPLQQFTATFDEYGDMTAMTPNKPNLRVVE